MQNTIIYLVRHAEPDKSCSDYTRRGLSETGRQQSLKIASFFNNVQIDRIYSSSMKVAVETIQPLANKLDLTISKTDLLKERLLSLETISNFHQAVSQTWRNFDCRHPEGESNNQAQKRVKPFINSVLQKAIGKSVILCSHGNLIVLILNIFDKNYSFQFWGTLKMPDILKATFKDNTLVNVERIWKG